MMPKYRLYFGLLVTKLYWTVSAVFDSHIGWDVPNNDVTRRAAWACAIAMRTGCCLIADIVVEEIYPNVSQHELYISL